MISRTSTLTGLLNLRGWYAPVTLFVGAAILYSLNLDRVLHPDELYHILAARGILDTGEPRIAEGTYERVYLYTLFLSKIFAAFGESLTVARIPSVLMIAGVVALMFTWLRKRAGLTAALTGSLLFAISPFAVDIALFTRFYSFQALAFFAGAILLYKAIEEGKGGFVLYFLSTLSLLFATYLQQTTLIGVAGLGTWVALRLGIPFVAAETTNRVRFFSILAAAIVIALCIGVWLDLFQIAWKHFRYVPLFSQSRANEFWFYFEHYLKNYPSLWPAIGIIAICALNYRFKPAFFALVVFGITFAVSSFAASKSLRYIIFAQPFLFILVGIGLASVAGSVMGWLRRSNSQLMNIVPFGSSTNSVIAGTLTTLAVLILVLSNPATGRTLAILGDLRAPVNWHAAKTELEPQLDEVDIVVTMTELEMLYHFGTYDLLYSPSRLDENPGAVDFDPDFRTGRPIIGSLPAFAAVLACYESGIVVTPAGRWRNPAFIPTPVANLIEAKTKRVELPKRSKVLAFIWRQNQSNSERCVPLPKFREANG